MFLRGYALKLMPANTLVKLCKYAMFLKGYTLAYMPLNTLVKPCRYAMFLRGGDLDNAFQYAYKTLRIRYGNDVNTLCQFANTLGV